MMAIELRLSISKTKINALQMALKNLRQDVYCDVTSSKDDLYTTDHRITQQQTSHVQKRPWTDQHSRCFMDITQSATLSSFASLSNSQSALIQANQKPGVNISFTLQNAASRSLSSDQAVIVGTTVMTKKETAVQASSKSMQSRLISPRIVLSSALKKKSAQTYENMENDSLNERT